MIRLQKYLAECGIASRRAAETLIAGGRIRVNGETAHLGQSIEPGKDRVVFDGKPVGQDEKIYLVLNKPGDVITTAKDTHGRRTVLDCVRGVPARIFPVGRLDRDVEGVLLLTNDGELAHRLMHPRYGVDKVYVAWVRGRVRPQTAAAMARGVRLDDGVTAPAEIEILESRPEATRIRLTLHEGRKREVKRLCAAAGHPVRSLERISFAGIRATGLEPGQWRHLSDLECQLLRRGAGLL